MILATTETIAGREAVACLGIVTAEAVISPTTAQNFTLSQAKLVQAREDMLFEARERMLDKLAAIAAERGADAVVGIRLDYEVVDPTWGMLLATGAGTAVKLGAPGSEEAE